MCNRLLLILAYLVFAVPVMAQVGGSGGGSSGSGGGGAVQTLTIASGVTTNTTTAAVAGVSGTKTFWGEVVCSSGACTQTQAIYGARENGAANGLLLCTLTLSGTARAQDVCTGVTADYPYLYVITTNTSGTAAEGGTYVFQ